MIPTFHWYLAILLMLLWVILVEIAFAVEIKHLPQLILRFNWSKLQSDRSRRAMRTNQINSLSESLPVTTLSALMTVFQSWNCRMSTRLTKHWRRLQFLFAVIKEFRSWGRARRHISNYTSFCCLKWNCKRTRNSI